MSYQQPPPETRGPEMRGPEMRGPETRGPAARPVADPVVLVWIGGVALAVLAYLVGPGHVIASALAWLQHVSWVLSDLARNLTVAAFDMLRAAAVGLFGTFVALSLLAIGRHRHGSLGLVLVSICFLLLVWDADGDYYGDHTRWLLALLVAASGAMSVTRRLRAPPLRGLGPADPWSPRAPSRASAAPPP